MIGATVARALALACLLAGAFTLRDMLFTPRSSAESSDPSTLEIIGWDADPTSARHCLSIASMSATRR